MDTGILILLNLTTVPFWWEFEHVSSKNEGIASLLSVLRLQYFRRTRWAWGFGVLWLLFLAIALAPTASGRSYAVSLGLIVTVILLQFAIGMAAFRRAAQFRVNKKS